MAKQITITVNNDAEASQILSLFKSSVGNSDPAKGPVSVMAAEARDCNVFVPVFATGGYIMQRLAGGV